MEESELKKVASLIKHKKVVFEYGEMEAHLQDVWVLKNKEFIKENRRFFMPPVVGISYILGNTVFEVIRIKDSLSIITEYWLVKEHYSLSKKLKNLTSDLFIVHVLLEEWSGDFGSKKHLKMLFKFKDLIPHGVKQYELPLYRGLTLTKKALLSLKKGNSVELQNRFISSWTPVFDFAKKNCFPSGVIVTCDPKTIQVFLNVNLFEDKMFGNLENIENPEDKEIMLIDSPEMLVVNPKQVVYFRGI